MTKYLVVIEKNLLAKGEPAIMVCKDERGGEVLGMFSTLDIYGPSRLDTYDEYSVWLTTEADWKGT